MRINHNIATIDTYTTQLLRTNNNKAPSVEKVAPGQQARESVDDAAAVSVSETARGQIRGLDQASKDIQARISLVQTADDALTETHGLLTQMRALAKQASEPSDVEVDGSAIQKEFDRLASEINRIAMQSTEGASGSEPEGSLAEEQREGAGEAPESTQTERRRVGFSPVAGTDVATPENAAATVRALDSAVADLSEHRVDINAYTKRVEATIRNLDLANENSAASDSRERDANTAKQMQDFTTSNRLTQSATAMLAQVNLQPPGFLQLLR